MSKKHIAIVANSLAQGGAERVVSILLKRYHDDIDYEVELILLEDTIAYDLPSGVKVTRLSSSAATLHPILKLLAIPWLSFKLYRYVKSTHLDLLVSFIFRADYVNVLASFLHKVPVIVSARVNASSTYASHSISAKINKQLISFFYKRAQKIINVSEGTKYDLVENFGIEADKQVVIYNPYDIALIEKLSREEIDLALERDKTIVAVSRFRPIKNIEMMLRAFSTLAEDMRLVLVGDGHEEDKLRALCRELKLQERVIFVGGQDNPYKYMSKAAIYLSASRSEGFPNAMVEAMICGCAIISTDCPSGPREILAPKSKSTEYLKEGIEYAEYGVLVAVDETKSMREALSYLLSHKDSLSAYQKKSLSRVNDFQLETIYKHYSNLFVDVIEEYAK